MVFFKMASGRDLNEICKSLKQRRREDTANFDFPPEIVTRPAASSSRGKSGIVQNEKQNDSNQDEEMPPGYEDFIKLYPDERTMQFADINNCPPHLVSKSNLPFYLRGL